MPAVGKTTAANSLCKEFNIQYYSGGDLLKEIAKEKGFAISVLDWWDNKNQQIYKKLYNIELGSDLSVFDKIIDTNDMDINQVCKSVIDSINESL